MSTSLVFKLCAGVAIACAMSVVAGGCAKPSARPTNSPHTTRLAVPEVWSDMIAVWAAEAVTGGEQLEIAAHDSPAAVLDELANGTADLALLPDDEALVNVEQLHALPLIRVRIGIISTTGKPLLLCTRMASAAPSTDPAGENHPDAAAAMQLVWRLLDYALSRRGQKVVADEPGLDPLLPWDLGSERLQLDNRN